jgi:uncharacterized lipoprotein YajG
MRRLPTMTGIVVLAGLTAIWLAGCAPKPATTSTAPVQPATAQAAVYTCPMHPEVTSDRPAKCPKCGMDLVVKEDAK